MREPKTQSDSVAKLSQSNGSNFFSSGLRQKVDQLMNVLWAGGVNNPMDSIEQLSYLIFLRLLSERDEQAANIEKGYQRIFAGPWARYAWGNFVTLTGNELFDTLRAAIEKLHELPGLTPTGQELFRNATLKIYDRPTLRAIVQIIAEMDLAPHEGHDLKGDMYEYLLSKLSQSGTNGQFRTPRHIIRLMVEMVEPKPTDIVCDPACGTCGFLVAVGESLRERHPEVKTNAKLRQHFHSGLFHGFDFDNTMLRIGSMNMLLHGVENPDITYRDSLAQDHAGEEEKYTLVLANPPFAGSLDYESCAKDLQQVVKTKKTELLFLALFLRLLKPGGRAAVIVPDGVLFGSSNAHKSLRRMLIEDQKLDAVISLPGGVFKPYAGVSTAILLFTKTNSGGTDQVWFYDVEADGWSLDDKRTPLLSDDKLGPLPSSALSEAEAAKNNLPDILARWKEREGKERKRPRTAQSFCVPKADLVAQGYDLSLNRYKEVVHQEVAHRAPTEILVDLAKLEAEIQQGLKELEGMLK